MPAQHLHREKGDGIYLHVFNKGIENRIIFRDEADFAVFICFLEGYLSVPKDAESTKKEFSIHGRTFRGVPHQPKNYLGKVELLAYNLQPDHFHLLLHQITQNSLQGFIRSLCTRYSMYFNRKYKHTGALFEGPYKSVQIKDEELLLLTRYLHKTGDYSTYSEYLKLKDTPWVSTKIVLSMKKGEGNYQDYVEKYEPDREENELLRKIVIEKIDTHLERSNLAETIPEMAAEPFEKVNLDQDLNPLQRKPEFFAVAIVFFLLLSFGIRNVIIFSAKSLKSSTLGASTAVSTVKPHPSPTPSVFPKTEEVQPKKIVTISITDGGEFVNIRKEPAPGSKKIGQAHDGETFELISIDVEWFGVKLPNGLTGFVSAKYVKGGTHE